MKPTEKISHSIYSAKGVYAVLVGSGISRPAQIPTGWEILLELLTRVAHLNDEKVSSENLPEWFKSKFNKEPTYSNVLEFLAATPAERSILIREFFERKIEGDDEDETVKQPTKAHRAIARLVRDGYIKVIITTNFDRLMEQALSEVGVTPSVIASEDDVNGALPIVHSKCTIIKVNGDYLDARIRNTSGELIEYGPNLKAFLGKIFDDFGLLIAGWSGEWDDGLRNSIQSAPNRRFSSFWATQGQLGEKATNLATNKACEIFQIQDADSLFEKIEDSISALDSLNKPHPISAKMAVASLKKYLAEEKYRIRLHDLVVGETKSAIEKLKNLKLDLNQPDQSGPKLLERLNIYDSNFEILYALFAHGSFWANKDQAGIFRDAFQSILDTADGQNGYDVWINFQRYPAMQLLMFAAMAAIKNRNYFVLAEIVNNATFARRSHDEPKLALYNLYPEKLIERRIGNLIPGYDRRKLPSSEILFAHLKKFASDLASSESDLQILFDKAEYLLGLKYAAAFDQQRTDNQNKTYRWGSFGSFLWKNEETKNVRKIWADEINSTGDNWQCLKHGLFKEKSKDLLLIKAEYDHFLDIVYHEMRW